MIERPANYAEEILVWKITFVHFELYESYEIKFPAKLSSFTVIISSAVVHSSYSSMPNGPTSSHDNMSSTSNHIAALAPARSQT